MKNRIVIYILITTLFLSACVSEEKKERTISISGAFALYPLVVKWAEEYKKEYPGTRFNISGGGAGKGMADALSHAVDIGMVSREISQEEIDQGVWWVGLTIDAVLPTISADNPHLDDIKKHGFTKEEFRDVFIEGKITNWSVFPEVVQNSPITVYTRSDACGAAGTWAKYMRGNQEDIKGVGIFGDPGLADAVIKDPSGIGFNNTIYIYDIKTGGKRKGIEVIPIDLDGDNIISSQENVYNSFEDILTAIATGMYPSPPARELYFVSKGKPEKQAVIDFIKWILTEGQQYIQEAGYVPLDQSVLDSYLQKLN